MVKDAKEAIDKVTGLDGWPKVLTSVGAVGALILMFGWLLYVARNDVIGIVAGLREDLREERKAGRDAIRELAKEVRSSTDELRRAVATNAEILHQVKRGHLPQ